jgi:FixJ family two-component response regulator
MAEKNTRILVIDDDATARRTLERFLTREGFTVSTAANANEGLLAVQVDQPDIVLSDIYMPGMSGLELQAQLNAERCRIPIIFITAHGDEKMRLQARREGAVEFLSKPFDNEVLLDGVRAALES